ncbi:MAG: hypothetical protein JWQ43_1434 [Glaciihabitans sp.]|nr:hypothetical protein [Glaciihabitans sp.]
MDVGGFGEVAVADNSQAGAQFDAGAGLAGFGGDGAVGGAALVAENGGGEQENDVHFPLCFPLRCRL